METGNHTKSKNALCITSGFAAQVLAGLKAKSLSADCERARWYHSGCGRS